jgi:hypothetical protein
MALESSGTKITSELVKSKLIQEDAWRKMDDRKCVNDSALISKSRDKQTAAE